MSIKTKCDLCGNDLTKKQISTMTDDELMKEIRSWVAERHTALYVPPSARYAKLLLERIDKLEAALNRIVHDGTVRCTDSRDPHPWWQTCADIANEALEP